MLQIILTTISMVLVQMKLDLYQLFSIRTCINFGLAKFFMKAYMLCICILKGSHCFRCLYVQFDHPSIKTVMSTYSLYARRQEYWNRSACLIAICKHVALQKSRKFLLSVSTLTGSQVITRTKLIANSPRVVSAHILF